MVDSTIARGVVYGFPSVMLDGTTQYDVQATDALGPGLIMFGGEDMQFGRPCWRSTRPAAGRILIVGAPGADDAAGAFYVYEGDGAFFEVRMRDYLENTTVSAGPIANGRFGAALAGTPSGTAPSYSKWDLLVGASPASRGRRRARWSAPPTCSAAAPAGFPAVRAGVRRGGRRTSSAPSSPAARSIRSTRSAISSRSRRSPRSAAPRRAPSTSSSTTTPVNAGDRATGPQGLAARCRTAPPGCCRTRRCRR